MEYEKKYKEALEKARVYWETDNDNTLDIKAKGTMEYLFPELAESEDEKIRKRIVKLVESFAQGQYKDCMIAWLEKQGKENPLKGTLGDVFDDLRAGLDPSPKQCEQKPMEWSEEDENNINKLLAICYGAKKV